MSTALRATQSFTASGGDRGHPSTGADTPSSSVGLRDFLRSHSLPCFARVGRSPPSTRRSRWTRDEEEEEEVLLYCVARVSYAAADEMSVVHKKPTQPTGQRFYVPLDCRAWFEVLSQDGISARPLGSVAELQAKLAVSSRCLVRQSVGAYVRRADAAAGTATYEVRIVRRGDVLTVSETVLAGGGRQLLRCTDRRGREVFLDVAQRGGLFTPIAGSTSVAGAHSVKSLLTKFRLPVMVRLLYGTVGQAPGSAYSTGVFRLVHLFSDEIVFSLPMSGALRPETTQRILAIPTRAKSIRLRRAPSRDETGTKLLQGLAKHCRLMVSQHLDTVLSAAAICEASWLLAGVEFEPLNVDPRRDRPPCSSSGAVAAAAVSSAADPEEEQLYREIEDIYNRIADPIVPRPIVFTTGGGGGGGGRGGGGEGGGGGGRSNRGLRRNVTVQERWMRSSGQKMRLVDDNWQMLPRQRTVSPPAVFPLRDADCDRSEPTPPLLLLPPAADAAVQGVRAEDQRQLRRDRPRRKTTAGAAPEGLPGRGREPPPLYEEIRFFASRKKMNVDETDAEVQKEAAVEHHVTTDADIDLRPGSSDDGSERNPDPVHEMRASPEVQKETKPDDGGGGGGEKGPEATLPGRRDRLFGRPKSIAGIPLRYNEPETTVRATDPLLPPRPSPPPKRGGSANDLVDLVVAESRRSPNPDSDPDVSRTPPDDPVERRQSSRVSTAVRTIGNASRSFLNTFRRLGGVGRSSALLVISDPREGRRPDAAAAAVTADEDKGPVKRPSQDPAPPPQVLGDRPDVVPEGNFINGSEEELRVAGLQL